MKSRYDNGFCRNCKGRIRMGEEIEKVNGKWVHAECPTRERTYETSLKDRNVPIPIGKEIDGDALARAIEDGEVENYLNFGEQPQRKKEFTPSKYQVAIFEEIEHGSGHLVIEAVAGSGKTTTIVKALDLTPKTAKVAFVAFNKHIAVELKKRAPEHVHVSTLHSLGLQTIRKSYPKLDIEDDKVGVLLDDIYPVSKQALLNGVITKDKRKENYAKRYSMRKLVSICKSTLIDVEDANQVVATIDKYGIEIDGKFQDEIIEKLPEVMKLCKEHIEMVDFDDMIWLPLVLNMEIEKFDFLMVDEAQDMNKSQIEFILKSVKDTGRIVAVGDRRQSLYGFRGADTDAIPNIINILQAKTLPLSVTYRCPASHVELAKQIVPQIEPRDNAPAGVIEELDYKKLVGILQAGDMVICRTNAPLVKPAFECIRAGRKAIIRGKDIGQSLVNLIKRFETNDLGEFEVALYEYFNTENTRLMDKGKEMQALLLQDRVETLHFIMGECDTVLDLLGKVEMLFSDNSIGIVFSSVHRAKGLEAENVFILHQHLKPHSKNLMPHPKASQEWEKVQEQNGMYVAFTRSKSNLYFVIGGENV